MRQPDKTAFARHLRRNMTPPETRLWLRIRGQHDLNFRRQHPVGPYVLDFYCAKAKLAVEVDGEIHSVGDNPQRDEVRDNWLSTQDIHVVRIPARDIFQYPDEIADGVIRLAYDLLKPR